MEITYNVVPNIKTMTGLKKVPDRVVYNVARMTLDMARSSSIIPKDTGKLRTTSMAFGVNKINGGYCIGSITDYASYVWNMEGVHWTTPGSNNKWYARTIQRHGETIKQIAITRGWSEVM